MSTRPVHEILTAAPVAFRANGELNEAGTRAILTNIAGSGVQGALVLGTTGEFPSLSERERNRIAEISLEELGGQRVVVHVGAASLFEVKRLIEGARSVGAKEIAVLTPYYLPAPVEAILDFYREVDEVCDGLRAYVYLFQDRTNNTLDVEALAQIAQLPSFAGAKLSGESLEQVKTFRQAVPADFELYTGNDQDLARTADFGAQGVVSGIASTYPAPFVRMRHALLNGDHEKIPLIQQEIDEVTGLILGDPARMKAALHLQGIDAGVARMAMATPSPADLELFRRANTKYAVGDAALRTHNKGN